MSARHASFSGNYNSSSRTRWNQGQDQVHLGISPLGLELSWHPGCETGSERLGYTRLFTRKLDHAPAAPSITERAPPSLAASDPLSRPKAIAPPQHNTKVRLLVATRLYGQGSEICS